MRTLFFSRHGDTENLTAGELPDPCPGDGEVRVRLRAAALNRLDLFVLRGLPGPALELPHIGGADGAGTVDALGSGVSDVAVGDEVVINPGLWCGRCEHCLRGEESLCVGFDVLGEHRNGTFAELVTVPASSLAARPAHLSWHESAAFGLTFVTAWRMLVTRARLAAGETVLIHGVGGGVSLAALAIARRMGARVLVTSSSDAKLQRAKELGADIVINYGSSDVVAEVRRITEKRGVDVVVDSTGQATWMASLRSAARGGRIVTCGATTGPSPTEEIRLIFWKQLSILGSTMGSRSDWAAMVRAVEEWGIRPVIDTVVPLGEGRSAFERLARGEQFGKLVLDIRGA